jgi:hypothetical protein
MILANKAAAGLGARSVQIIHSTLRTMLSEAMRAELVEGNVATLHVLPDVQHATFQNSASFSVGEGPPNPSRESHQSGPWPHWFSRPAAHCASLLLAQSVPARVVMKIVGHTQLAMTTDLCSHVMPTRYAKRRTPWIVFSSSRTELGCCQLALCAAF